MKKILTALLATALILTAGPIQAKRPATLGAFTQTYSYSGFSRLDIGLTEDEPGTRRGNNYHTQGTLSVDIVRGDTYGVELTVNDESYAGLYHISLNRGTLYVKCSQGNKKYSPTPEATVTVHTPDLTDLHIQGVAYVSTEGHFDTDNLTLSISGASNLRDIDVTCRNADLTLRGAVNVSGIRINAGNSVTIKASGASNIRGLDLRADDIRIDSGGANNIKDFTSESTSFFYGGSGSSNLRQGRSTFRSGSIATSGACYVKLNAVSENLKVNVSGAGVTTINGEGGRTTVVLSGSSKADLADYRSKEVDVHATGVCHAEVYASEVLTYSLSSYSTIDYYGNPKIINGSTPSVRGH